MHDPDRVGPGSSEGGRHQYGRQGGKPQKQGARDHASHLQRCQCQAPRAIAVLLSTRNTRLHDLIGGNHQDIVQQIVHALRQCVDADRLHAEFLCYQQYR